MRPYARQMTSHAVQPHPALRRLVTSYHGYHYTGMAAGVHHGLPSTELTLVLAFDEPIDVAWQHDATSRGLHWAMASGLHTGPALIHHTGFQHGIQLGLTPRGARALLGLPAAGLAAAMVPLEELVGDQMYDEVAGAASWDQRFRALDRHLLALVTERHHGQQIRSELLWAWARLEKTSGGVRVDRLADEIGWSRRHFSAQFGGEFGLGPKQAARVLRFQRARDLLLGPTRSRLTDVAATCGYADQAHLTRDWRELAGYTPTQWRREELPFLQDTAASG